MSEPPTVYDTPPTRRNTTTTRATRYISAHDAWTVESIKQCWLKNCDQNHVRGMACESCDRTAHSQCYGVTLFVMDNEDYSLTNLSYLFV